MARTNAEIERPSAARDERTDSERDAEEAGVAYLRALGELFPKRRRPISQDERTRRAVAAGTLKTST